MSAELAERVRKQLADMPGAAEIRMFGGLCFTLKGNMLVGIMNDGGLLVRVGPSGMTEALSRPGASPMEMGARVMRGFVVVSPDALDDAALSQWMATARAFVEPMPPKQKKPAKRPKAI